MTSTGVGAAAVDVGATARVLLVDDHTLLADALRLVLQRHGFRNVTTVAELTPAGIMSAAAEYRTDVVVLDLNLGAFGSSLPIVGPLREAGASVIAVSDELDVVGLASALDLGAAGVISKSEGPDRLVALILDVVHGTSTVRGPARVQLTRAVAEQRVAEQRRAQRFERLSLCEREVLGLLTTGMSADEIAAHRYVSVTTVRSQIRSVLSKLGVKSQVAAVALANHEGWSPEYLPA